MHQEQKNQGVEAGGINPNAKTGESTVTLSLRSNGARKAWIAVYAGPKAKRQRLLGAYECVGFNSEMLAQDVVIGMSALNWGYTVQCDGCESYRDNEPITPASAAEIATPVKITVIRDAAHLAEVPYAAIRARDYSMGDKPASFIPRNAHACNVCEDGYKAIHNGICTNAACPFSVVGGNR